MGRPVIAGGSGARAVTKSVNTSQTPKRARSSRSIKPSEATIAEGQRQNFCDIPNAETLPELELDGSIEAPPRKQYHVNLEFSELNSNSPCAIDPKKNVEHASGLPQLNMHPVAGPSSKTLENVIAEAVSDITEKLHSYSFCEQLAPVQQELDSHKAQLTDLKEKVSSLIESFETKIRNLTSEIQDLCARAKSSPSLDTSIATVQEHSVRIPEPPSTPKRVRTPYRPSFAYVNMPHFLFSSLSRM